MKKVIIIGAGISGLTLAYLLEKQGLTVTIIEKENRVGGLIRTTNGFEEGARGFRPTGKGVLTCNVAREVGLSLLPVAATAKKRYIAHEEKLNEVNFRYLLRYGGLLPLLLEPFRKKGKDDETIASFFRRRVGQQYLAHLITPLCHGIFAQDPEKLSIQACFPSLWAAEQNDGSLLKGFFKHKKAKGMAPLYSFVGGMQRLPEALAHHLKGEILLEERLLSIHPERKGASVCLQGKSLEADVVVNATPDLFNLAPSFPQECVPLTVIHCGFLETQPLPSGFGFLVQRVTDGLLGITFDSQIFPENNAPYKTRLSLIWQGEADPHALEKTLTRTLKIRQTPDYIHTTFIPKAIYQYPVGHLSYLEQLEKSLPPSILLASSRFHGVGINECIAHAHHLSSLFSRN